MTEVVLPAGTAISVGGRVFVYLFCPRLTHGRSCQETPQVDEPGQRPATADARSPGGRPRS